MAAEASTPSDGPSFVVTHLIEGLRHEMPEDLHARLDEYAERAAQSNDDPRAEWHRAYRCAKWAERTVALPAHSHLGAEVKRAIEAVKEVEKTVGGELTDALELPFGMAVSAGFEAEVTWVYEAVRVAGKVAAKIGWDSVPWSDLVEEVLAVDG